MEKKAVLAYYDGRHKAIAAALKITFQAVYGWGDVVPFYSAHELERITKGKLRVDLKCYSRGKPIKCAA